MYLASYLFSLIIHFWFSFDTLFFFFINSKYSFRYVFSYENLVREDFEKNNFTKLGRITGLGRGTKSLERKNFAIFTRSRRGREDFWKSVAPSPSRNKSRVGFRKISVEQTAFKGLARGFLSSLRILFPPFTATPPLPFSFPRATPGTSVFFFFHSLASFSTFHFSFPRDPFDHSPIMLR